MAKSPPSFNLFVDDFLSGCRLLDTDEVGAYILLLCEQWKTGHIPETDSMRMRAAQIGCPDQWARVWSMIRCKFEMVENQDIVDCDPSEEKRHVFANMRMHEDRNEELPKYNQRREIARKNGLKGGRPKNPEETQRLTQRVFKKNPDGKREEGRGKSSSKEEKRIGSDAIEFLASIWNSHASKNSKKLSGIRKLTAERKTKIRAREPDWQGNFCEAVKVLPLGGDGWQPTFDWLISNDTNVLRLLEGEFDWRCSDDPAMRKLQSVRRRNAARERELEREKEKAAREKECEYRRQGTLSSIGDLVKKFEEEK